VTIDGHTVVLLDVSSPGGVPTIQVEVDGTVSTVQRGDTFGPGNRFEFVSSSGSCATIRAGETSYVLCVNPQK
jgi:hypothetical protein